MKKGSFASDDTIVTHPELPYERTVYEGPMYPGTLTYPRSVPTIKGQMTDRVIRKGLERSG